jgi:hypothetical protein
MNNEYSKDTIFFSQNSLIDLSSDIILRPLYYYKKDVKTESSEQEENIAIQTK